MQAADDLAELEQTNASLKMRLASAELTASRLQAEAGQLKTRIAELELAARVLRFDLDGVRLTDPDKREVWLVLQGRRRKCFNADVYCALFSDSTDLTIIENPDHIELGGDLLPGTCLIRSIDDGVIFLAVPSGDKCVLHRVESFEVFKRYGFDLDKVHLVPTSVLVSCVVGRAVSLPS